MERGNKDFKRGARWARGGCLKKEGAATPLQTMNIVLME